MMHEISGLLKRRSVIVPVLIILILFGSILLIDRVVYPLPTGRLKPDHAHFIYSREGHLLNCFASRDHFWRKPVSLEKISPKLVRTVLASEDRWFYYHPGFNPISLVTAAIDNIKAGKVVRGGSTITMQIARMMEPKERTVGSKIIELARAVQLECHYTKNELLEIYFNLIPYGGNIEGVGAASFFYFNKSPDNLTLSEAAILTAIPASPNMFRPDLNPDKCRARRDRILKTLQQKNIIGTAELETALSEEIPGSRTDRPFVAPHFCQDIINSDPSETVHHSTIDFELQIKCEKLAENYNRTLKDKGINNLSLVVIDNWSGDILAMVGSPDFSDTRHNGQINGAMALRSPGSALKPFAYGLGFESGTITPMSCLDDIPVNYSGYSPDNYDEKFHGIVSVSDALINSYNVPAVNITARIGLQQFYQLLQNGGLTSLNKNYYDFGLPLVLGACEISLVELSNLYATLGREGYYLPTRVTLDKKKADGKRILSEETCFLLSDILSNLKRPNLNASWEFTADQPTVAWKTGTSYGRKDAWAIGYNPSLTIGVWTGNFSGEGSAYLVGAETSAPLMLDLFHELTKNSGPEWFDIPPGIGTRDVCISSGMPAGPDCPGTRKDYYIKQVSSVATCNIHKAILVDHDHRYMLCPACRYTAEAIDTLVIERWPARLSRWLLNRGQVTSLPPHNPDCLGLLADDVPVIISPENNAVYELRKNAPLEYQKIVFRASAALASESIHWFLDDRLYATTKTGSEVLYIPEAGYHNLRCVDDYGRSSRINFEIK